MACPEKRVRNFQDSVKDYTDGNQILNALKPRSAVLLNLSRTKAITTTDMTG